VNGLRNVRLRVLRQNWRCVAQRVETILVLLVLVLIWLVARSTAEHLSSRCRERFAALVVTHCLNAGFQNRKDMGSYQNYNDWPSAVVSPVRRCLQPWKRKWLSEAILKTLALSNRSELYHAVLWCLNLAPTGSYSHKRKQLASNTLAFSSAALYCKVVGGHADTSERSSEAVERLTQLGCVLRANNTCLRLVHL